MIEAFEIGVSLALKDGVSDALAQAQRDVHALEQAVRGSGVSVRSLKDAAARAVGASVSTPAVEGARKPLSTDTAESVALVEADRAAINSGYSIANLVVTAEGPAASVLPEESVATVPSSREALGPQWVVPPKGEAAVTATAPAAPVVVQQSFGIGRPDAGIETVAPALRPLATMPFLEPSPSGTGRESQSASGTYAIPPVSPSAPFYASAETPARVSEVGARPRPAADATPSRSGGLDTTSMQALGERTVGLDASQQGSAAPPAQERDARPQEGDVFLDGVLVGRWMSRYLNREAERASAGPTGFDAKRSRLLPGVTVGG